MIGQLRGQILSKHPPQLLLDVGGVGYELEAPMSTFYDLPAVGETVVLITHLAVREDAHVLYGFLRERDRALFRALLKVPGLAHAWRWRSSPAWMRRALRNVSSWTTATP